MVTHSKYILSIDQGTTSSRAMLFDELGEPIATHQKVHQQFYPQLGWVEHDPNEIWENVLTCCHQVIKQSQVSIAQIQAIGLTNQRETTVLWDKASGEPVYPAIVWQDRRTQAICEDLKPSEGMVTSKTGLLLDPYFSASKIQWILTHVPEASKKLRTGDLAFGTMETYLLWRLTNGRSHLTDCTNASRTLLYNIHNLEWDKELLDLFGIPAEILPEVKKNVDHFGEVESHIFGQPIPVTGMAGDQQAATVGQACFQKGMLKSTFGTGCFMMLNTGETPISSQNRLLTTLAYQIDKPVYALEGSIFNAGTVIQWLRDNLKLIQTSAESSEVSASLSSNEGVYFVPAFTGLGAPYWDPQATGTIVGLRRDTAAKHIVRAGLESIVYQSCDLIYAMKQDYGHLPEKLHVDGGMINNPWLMQYLSDMLNLDVYCAKVSETTCLGAAWLAALGCGLYQSISDIEKLWAYKSIYKPQQVDEKKDHCYRQWKKVIGKMLIKS